MMGKNSPGDGKEKSELVRVANLTSVGISLILCTMIGYGIGVWLDKLFHTSPWLMLAFLLLGIGAGFLNVFRTIFRDTDDSGGGDGDRRG